MNWRSTTLRIAGLVFLLQVAAAVVLLVGVSVVVQRQGAAHAAATAGVLRNDLLATYDGGGIAALSEEVTRRSERMVTPGTVMLLVDARGRHIAGNLNVWPSPAMPDDLSETRLVQSGHGAAEAMRVRATALPGGYRLLTGAIVESDRRFRGYLGAAVAVALVLAVVFAAVAAVLITRLIVTRLGRTAATLRAVRGGDFGRRVETDLSGDAFAALSGEVNAALDRVEVLVGELTLATDALAHDLKSPLTRLRGWLDRAARAAHEPEVQDAVDHALGEGERLLSIVETALRITRAEAGIGRDSFAAVDLATEIEDIAEIYGPIVEDAGRSIRVEAPSPLTVAVHRELLAQALGNLVDNALKYGRGAITLTLTERTRGATITVSDGGEGVPESLHHTALRRFGRVDEARSTMGAGLGLSLVAAVARLHDGDVRLLNLPDGFAVCLDLYARAGSDRPV